MADFSITLADRRAPWDVANWSDGQRPLVTPEGFATASEMLGSAGLAGWDVQKKQLYVGRKGPVAAGAYATVTADGRVLGVVGNAYKVLQMEEAFAFGDALVDSGDAKWERAGQFKGGRIVFGAMELCHLGISVPGDDSEIKPYLLLVNSFDGSHPFQGVLAFIRPVCINTFEAARGTDTPYRFSIRHSSLLNGKIQSARDALGIAFNHTAEVKELVSSLALKKIVDDQVLDIFRKYVWPVDAESMAPGNLDKHSSTLAYENYLTSPTIDGIRGTAWGAFNAVTEYVDHVVEYKSKVYEDSGLRGDTLMFGVGQQRKDRAMAALLAL